jgi:hypothetical protein
MENDDTKNCKVCQKPLRGRSDKKFCDDYCRNVYNNKLKEGERQNTDIKEISQALRKNRKVLEMLLPHSENSVKASRDELLRMGFHFDYITDYYRTKSGETYHYCFDYGYLPLGNNMNLIVRKKK